MNLLKGSLILKFLALVSAIVTYTYIHNELYQIKSEITPDQSYRLLKPTAKTLPINVRLATEPPEGYAIVESEVRSVPSHIIVIGPEALLDDASAAETALVDVGDNTRTVKKKIPLESVAGTHLSGDPYFVEVTVPIHKIETPAESA